MRGYWMKLLAARVHRLNKSSSGMNADERTYDLRLRVLTASRHSALPTHINVDILRHSFGCQSMRNALL